MISTQNAMKPKNTSTIGRLKSSRSNQVVDSEGTEHDRKKTTVMALDAHLSSFGDFNQHSLSIPKLQVYVLGDMDETEALNLPDNNQISEHPNSLFVLSPEFKAN
jgi:hypothetical protein